MVKPNNIGEDAPMNMIRNIIAVVATQVRKFLSNLLNTG